jgi:two-component system, chemotaxis family, protein-glutamate methylesterase/glutaminase
MNTVVAPAHPAPAIRKPIRVMVVDDAIVVRRQLTRWIGDEKDMMVAACLRTGREAVDQLETCNPDVVVLDVDMPELDGISALPQLLKKKRDLVVIMASTLTRRSAEISLRALSLGAADYVPSPRSRSTPTVRLISAASCSTRSAVLAAAAACSFASVGLPPPRARSSCGRSARSCRLAKVPDLRCGHSGSRGRARF